jgi:predicted transcriptional regulator
MATKQKIDVRDQILKHLAGDDRNLKWLSRKSDIPYPTIYSCLELKNFNLSESNLEKINTALGTSFKA